MQADQYLLPAGDLLVVAHDRSQQLDPGTCTGSGKGAQLILWLGGSHGLEVHHQPEFW
jgi:hypothetical protein